MLYYKVTCCICTQRILATLSKVNHGTLWTSGTDLHTTNSEKAFGLHLRHCQTSSEATRQPCPYHNTHQQQLMHRPSVWLHWRRNGAGRFGGQKKATAPNAKLELLVQP